MVCGHTAAAMGQGRFLLWPCPYRPLVNDPKQKCWDNQAFEEKSQLHSRTLSRDPRHQRLFVNDHPPGHAQVVVQNTSVVESPWSGESHPEPRHGQRRLLQGCDGGGWRRRGRWRGWAPVLKRRDKKS